MTAPPSTPVAMSWHEASARRLERHGLVEARRFADSGSATRAICGAHAQIMAAAEISIAVRMDGATRRDVQHALWTARTLVKTYGPRGTVHLLPTTDLAMWSGALGAIPGPANSFPENVRLTPNQEDAVIAAIDDSLRDVELVDIQLGAAVMVRTGAWASDLVMPAFNGMWPRWRQAIPAAAHRGVLCFGPNRGRSVTYTHPTRWHRRFRPDEPATAVARLVRSHLHAYGPATPNTFARWLSAPVGWARASFAQLQESIQPVSLDGDLAWIDASDTSPDSVEVPEVLLLPYFDPFVVGSHPRERPYPGRASERALARGQAGNYPILLVDGTVAGGSTSPWSLSSTCPHGTAGYWTIRWIGSRRSRLPSLASRSARSTLGLTPDRFSIPPACISRDTEARPGGRTSARRRMRKSGVSDEIRRAVCPGSGHSGWKAMRPEPTEPMWEPESRRRRERRSRGKR